MRYALAPAVAALAWLAACSAPAPVPDESLALLDAFHDPFGRRPVLLDVREGAHLRVGYVDSLFFAGSPEEQREEAHAIALHLWRAFAGTGGADTVSVAFSGPPGSGAARAGRTRHTFLFYADQLRGPAGAAGEARAP